LWSLVAWKCPEGSDHTFHILSFLCMCLDTHSLQGLQPHHIRLRMRTLLPQREISKGQGDPGPGLRDPLSLACPTEVGPKLLSIHLLLSFSPAADTPTKLPAKHGTG
jgi:hypothetical protein